jgi:hypothetical protein
MAANKEFNLKETFFNYYKSPKEFSKKQWIVISIWCFLNIVIGALYLSAGASIGLALMNVIYGELKTNNKSIRLDGKAIFDGYRKPETIRYLPQFNFIPEKTSTWKCIILII